MTNNKRFISLTGTTCAGKSTVLKALKQSDTERFMIIPQVTSRNPRTDDSSECFIYTKNIIPQEMFLYNKDLSYGISRQSLLDFMNSSYQIALAVNGTDELEMLNNRSGKIPSIEFTNVLLTFSDNYERELFFLGQHLKKYFDEENFIKRYNFFKEHAKNKFFNPSFVENHIDLHLTREMQLSRWCFEFAKLIGVSPNKLLYNLNSRIKTCEKQRRYICSGTAEGITRIITSLQGNKR